MARPTKYLVKYNKLVEQYSLLGATDKQMATFLGVSESTFNKWKKDYPGFSKSLKRGKEIADAKVALSLFKRATGYQHKDLWIGQFKGNIVTKEYTKHYPPDTTAAIFWLKNRQPEIWRDAKQVESNLNIIINDTRNLILQRLNKIRKSEPAPEDN